MGIEPCPSAVGGHQSSLGLCWMVLSCYFDLVLCCRVSSECLLEKKGIFLLLDGEVDY